MFDILGYYEAKTLTDAIEQLASVSNSKIVAGGTDVLVKSRGRDEEFVNCNLIGITRIPELQGVKLESDGTLSIGATCSFSKVANNEVVKKNAPTVAFAASTVGGPQTRNIGTIGGNICNGATSADTAPILFAHNAILEVHSKDGVKDISIHDFYKGPGKVDLKQGEILARIKIKKADYENFKGHYTKYAQRNAMDIANLSCAVLVKESGGKVAELRVSYGVAGPTPLRATIAEEFAKGKELNDKTIDEIGAKCLETSKTRDSWRASKEYRDHLVKLLAIRGIKFATGRDK